ncbi:MAG: HlyD family type I secretion periplasmic adaptor subunit, partial [Paracoccaceae bacterium]|nr:HlyD family type I secretion periplasmic adaptor subunit [Paracoccaceae bacterium]
AAEASERELHLRRMRLKAVSERLLAEYQEADRLQFSQELLDAGDDPEIMAILDSQTLAYEVSRNALVSETDLFDRNIAAMRVRERGYAAQLDAIRLRSEILEEEFADKSSLFERGLVEKSSLNAVRRMKAESDGQVARLEAEIDEIRQMLLRYQGEIDAARAAYRQAALDELGPIQADLESVTEQERRASNILKRSVVRSPVDGTIVRIHYHTAGGVIETGKPIAEILPSDAPLMIETQITRNDIDSLRLGQEATVRLTALNQRTTPILYGEVFYISADAMPRTDTGSRQEIFVARISVPQEELARIPGFVPTSGMPAEIMIRTQTRTFAQYLAKPIADSMARAFREQ